MLLRVHSARTRVLASLCVATVMGCGESGGGASGNGGTADVGRPDAMAAGGADARPASDAVPPEGGQVPDAGAPESDAGDGPADARPGSDAVVRPDAALRPVDLLCLPCTADGRCETPGAICLTNQATGEQFCGLDCSGPDAACPRGSSCFELGEGAFQCAPAAATCATWPPSDLGAPCAADADCRLGADTCADGLCTTACATSADCAPGFKTCLAGHCLPDWMGGPEGCGRGATACGEGGACPEGSTCQSGDGEAPLPTTVAPFCARACDADPGVCGPGERCGRFGGRALCLPEPCACLDEAAPERGLLDEALVAAGLNRCEAIFRRETMDLFPPNLSADGWRLPFYDAVHRHAPRAIGWGREVTDALAGPGAGAAAAEVIRAAGAVLTGGPLPTAAEAAPAPSLLEALRTLWVAAGDGPRFNEGLVANAIGDVPAGLQARLAPVVAAMARVAVARDEMLTAAGYDIPRAAALFERLPGAMVSLPGGVNFADAVEVAALQGGLAPGAFLAAGADLAALIEGTDWAPVRGTTGYSVDLATPMGRFRVQDAGTQVLSGQGHFLLVFDAGGDDRYEAAVAATRGVTEPVSVVIELGGADRYGYPEMDDPPEVPGLPPADREGRGIGGYPAARSETPRQGVGILGAGMLFDFEGDDVYRSLRLSQGATVGGLGLLVDAAGRDEYGCEQGCQAAAAFGVAALIDREGDDAYAGAQLVQGFAGLRGVAYLHDAAGADRYFALPGDPLFGGTILYGNPQNPSGSNSSFAQGAGFGRRADADGTYASGGLGVLQDLGGDDVYTVDIFGQGTGYWFGTGVLRDRGGHDVYNGRWYVQGSSAHFAMSLFYEDAGDDRYNEGLPLVAGEGELGPVILATATGQGHDLSVGVLVDAAGNDHYVAPGLGVGGGNDNGIGFFLDGGGDDRYDVPDGTTFGGANTGDRGVPFDAALCLGLFVDADGADTYAGVAAESPVGDGRTWTLDARKPGHKPGEHGAGLDLSGRALSPAEGAAAP
jgi:hypothetical protein